MVIKTKFTFLDVISTISERVFAFASTVLELNQLDLVNEVVGIDEYLALKHYQLKLTEQLC